MSNGGQGLFIYGVMDGTVCRRCLAISKVATRSINWTTLIVLKSLINMTVSTEWSNLNDP